ncbi:hypothetical protein NX059_003368 [Plenodomus lindquistii]|nr:hypothetical protein NX059_003368 [Plenodomus lindquistii]
MAPAEPEWKCNFALSKVAEPYTKLPGICGDIITVQVGSIAGDTSNIDLKDYLARSNNILGDRANDILDNDPVDAAYGSNDCSESDDLKRGFLHLGVLEVSPSTETTLDIIGEDPGANTDINMGLDVEVDEDYTYETASPTSAEDYISETSDDDADGYPVKIFHVHKDVLSKTSNFFRAALKKEWTARRKGPIKLSDEDPDLFEMYVQWLYSQKVSIKSSHPGYHNVLFSLVQSHILGARLLDPKYQNAVMKALILYADETRMYPHDGILRYAYDNTLPSSPLRMILIDFWV